LALLAAKSASLRRALSAWDCEARRSKVWNILGLLLCLALAFSVPLEGLLLGMAVLLLAMFLRWGLSKLH
jgi:hypothetical protein